MENANFFILLDSKYSELRCTIITNDELTIPEKINNLDSLFKQYCADIKRYLDEKNKLIQDAIKANEIKPIEISDSMKEWVNKNISKRTRGRIDAKYKI